MSLGFYPHEGLDISCLQHFLSRIWFHRLDCNQGLKRSRWPTRQGFGEQIVQLRVSLFLILVFFIQHSWQIQTSKRTKQVSWVGQSRRLPHHLVLAFPDPHGHGHVHHAKGSSSDLWGKIWGWSKYLNSKIGFHLPAKEKSLPRKLKCSVVR